MPQPNFASCNNCFYLTNPTRIINGVPTSYHACGRNAPNTASTDVSQASEAQWTEIALTDWCGFWANANPAIYNKFPSTYDTGVAFLRALLETTDATPTPATNYTIWRTTGSVYNRQVSGRALIAWLDQSDTSLGGYQYIDFLYRFGLGNASASSSYGNLAAPGGAITFTGNGGLDVGIVVTGLAAGTASSGSLGWSVGLRVDQGQTVQIPDNPGFRFQTCPNCFFAGTRQRLVNGTLTNYLACLKRAPNVVTTDVAPSSNAQWPQVANTDWCGEFYPIDPQVYGQQNGADASSMFLHQTYFGTVSGTGGPAISETLIAIPFLSDTGNIACVINVTASYTDQIPGSSGTIDGGWQQMSAMLSHGTGMNLIATSPIAVNGTLSVGTLTVILDPLFNKFDIDMVGLSAFATSTGISIYFDVAVDIDWLGAPPPAAVQGGVRLGAAGGLGRGGG